MFKEQFSMPMESKKEELPKEQEIQKEDEEKLENAFSKKISSKDDLTEKETDEAIKENPKGFVCWFEKLKNKLTDVDYKKIYKNDKVRKALIVTSVPFAILRASGAKAEVKSEDIVSGLINQPAITEKMENRRFATIKPEELVFLTQKNQREKIANNINMEMQSFDNLSGVLNNRLQGKKDLLSDEVVNKLEKGEEVIDFAGNMKSNIEKSNQVYKNIANIKDLNFKFKKQQENVNKIFENGKLHYMNMIKVFGESLVALQFSAIVHELGHEEEALHQGASGTNVDINFISGYTHYKGEIRNKAAFSAAGINKSQMWSDFLVNSLKSEKTSNQVMALLALVARTDGMTYALCNYLCEQGGRKQDIVEYAKETNTSISSLTLGLSVAFLGNIENWQLAGIALGGGKELSCQTLQLLLFIN